MKNPIKAKKKREKRCDRVINIDVIQKDGLKGSFNDIVLIGICEITRQTLSIPHVFAYIYAKFRK